MFQTVMQIFEPACVFVGYAYIIGWVFRFINVFWRYFFGTKASTERYGENSWAVITGATDGIGRAAAMYLAELGFNIVLIARNEEKL